MTVDARADCPTCRVEGARVEVLSEGGGEGLPGLPDLEARIVASRCRVCEGGVPATAEELTRALAAWAMEEGFASADELVASSFVLPSRGEILAALRAGEPVETSFDVVDYLFSSGAGQSTAGGPVPRADAPPASVRFVVPAKPPAEDAFAPRPPMEAVAHAEGSPLAALTNPVDEMFALASVAAADGSVTPEDLAVLAQAAAIRGLPPLPLEEIRVRRPGEVSAPPTLVERERVLGEMFHLAWSNEELDESEVRVIRDFARAWGVDPQRITEWTTIVTADGKSKVARWIDRVGYFLFPGW